VAGIIRAGKAVRTQGLTYNPRGQDGSVYLMQGVRRLLRQVYYRLRAERPASWWGKFMLAWRYDCHVSPRAYVYQPRRIRLAKDVEVQDRALLNFHSTRGSGVNLTIGACTRILPDAKLIPQGGSITIGEHCTVQYGTLLYGEGGLTIGDHTRIAAYCVIAPMNHVYADPKTPIRLQGETARGIRIGRDVWLGNGVRVVDGVEIGDGCVVGAGSVVTKSLPPYSIAVGAPARVIKRRE
jgi:acetyltransferase-like isoleucine patch superfamily enzyme